MTPGRSLPGNTSGRSNAPVASTTVPARIVQWRWRGSPLPATACGRSRAPARRACCRRSSPRPWCAAAGGHCRVRTVPRPLAPAQSAAGMPSMVSPDQLAEPPKRASSSARMTRAPRVGCGLGRHQPGRAGADHQHVAEGVHALVARGVPGVAGAAEAGGAADEMLAEHPEARALQRPEHRAHEGLVVEARAETSLPPSWLTAPTSKASDGKRFWLTTVRPSWISSMRRRDVRLAHVALQHRHQRVRLVDAGGKHAARAMVFERAAEQRTPLASSAEASVSPGWPVIGLAVEGEADRARRGRSAPPVVARRGLTRVLPPCGGRRSGVAGVAGEADAAKSCASACCG